MSFHFFLWCKPTVKVKMRKKWKYIYIYICFGVFFSPKETLLPLCLITTVIASLSCWGTGTGWQDRVLVALLLPSALCCLRQQVTSSVPRAVLENIQIPGARWASLHKRWLCISRTTCRVSLSFFIIIYFFYSSLSDFFSKSVLDDMKERKREPW